MKLPRPLGMSQVHLHQMPGVPGERRIGIVTGDIRRARCAQVWVNPENTEMRMARIDEHSISAIVRYEGARRDTAGRVTADLIADELDQRVGALRPVAAGTVVITGPGELVRFGVRHVAHTAAVQGEPGAGYRQVQDVGRCVSIVLDAVDQLPGPVPVESVLFPLLGAGQGGGDPAATADALVGVAVDRFAAVPASPVTSVYLLAYTDRDLAACRAACDRRGLREVPRGVDGRAADAPGTAGDAAPASPPAGTSTTPMSLQMGFTVDVVGFGTRPAPEREVVQRRLATLLRRVLADAGADLDHLDHHWHGDGASVYLSSDTDPNQVLTSLLGGTIRNLAEDNARRGDRIRLRMAVTVGLVGQGTVGYAGPMVVDLARMVDGPPLRRALTDAPDADLVVLLSDYVYSHIIGSGYTKLQAARFKRVEVTVKEFSAPAWLWVSRHPG